MTQSEFTVDKKWSILLQSSRKFVALAKYRKEEEDYMEAVCVLNQILIHITSQVFHQKPHHIEKEIQQLNIEIYLQLVDIFMKLGKYEAAKECLTQVFKINSQYCVAQQLIQTIQQRCDNVINKSGKMCNTQISEQETCEY